MKHQSKLVKIWIQDLKKPVIDKYERATILKEYMTIRKLTGRQLSIEIGVPRSTIEDWLLFSKITPEEMQTYRNNGYTETDITKLLRSNKKIDVKELKAVDLILDKAIHKLSSSATTNYISSHTLEKIKSLEKAISTFKFRLNNKGLLK